ncbi:MAG: hypothetical protein ACXAD7_14700 [Candidatus Kariarchaeaceae archaeon]
MVRHLPQDKSLIKGLILTKVGDAGPELISNLSPIGDDDALITALHLISLAGLEDDDFDEDASKILGPLPVKGTSEYKSLYYSELLDTSDETDERLIEHGAKVGIILLFDTDKLPDIRRAAGLIEPYLKLYLERISETADLTKEFGLKLKEHLVDLISKPRIRTFWMDGEKIYEYKDPGWVNRTDDMMVLDEKDKKIYVVTQPATSPFEVRQMYNRINEFNFEFYQGAFTIVTLESFGEVQPMLIKHGIKVR